MTTIVSSEHEKISYVIPAVAILHSYLSKRGNDCGVQTMKDKFKKSLETRFMSGDHDIFKNQNYALATFLDPRFKGKFLKDQNKTKKYFCNVIRQEIKK